MTWVKAARFAYDETIVYCEFCGRPMRGRTWEVEVAGHNRRFCEPSCEAAYREHWFPSLEQT